MKVIIAIILSLVAVNASAQETQQQSPGTLVETQIGQLVIQGANLQAQVWNLQRELSDANKQITDLKAKYEPQKKPGENPK